MFGVLLGGVLCVVERPKVARKPVPDEPCGVRRVWLGLGWAKDHSRVSTGGTLAAIEARVFVEAPTHVSSPEGTCRVVALVALV